MRYLMFGLFLANYIRPFRIIPNSFSHTCEYLDIYHLVHRSHTEEFVGITNCRRAICAHGLTGSSGVNRSCIHILSFKNGTFWTSDVVTPKLRFFAKQATWRVLWLLPRCCWRISVIFAEGINSVSYANLHKWTTMFARGFHWAIIHHKRISIDYPGSLKWQHFSTPQLCLGN